MSATNPSTTALTRAGSARNEAPKTPEKRPLPVHKVTPTRKKPNAKVTEPPKKAGSKELSTACTTPGTPEATRSSLAAKLHATLKKKSQERFKISAKRELVRETFKIVLQIPMELWVEHGARLKNWLWTHYSLVGIYPNKIVKLEGMQNVDAMLAFLAQIGALVSDEDRAVFAAAEEGMEGKPLKMKIVVDKAVGVKMLAVTGLFLKDVTDAYPAVARFAFLVKRGDEWMVLIAATSGQDLNMKLAELEVAAAGYKFPPERDVADLTAQLSEEDFHAAYLQSDAVDQTTLYNAYLLRDALAMNMRDGGPIGGPYTYDPRNNTLKGSPGIYGNYEELKDLAVEVGVTLIDATDAAP